jgi:KDO2-lipid IV(A) lauroyltransferase
LGRGLIGGTAHFGNFNMFVLLTAAHLKHRQEIIVPVEHLKPEAVFEIVLKQRAAQGIQLVPVDAAGRLLVKKLREGAVLGLATDLDVTHSGRIVDFFGEPARLPDGAATLAAKYDVPMILGFCRRLDDNNKSAVVIEPLSFEKSGDLEQDTLRALGEIVQRLEWWIGKYPDQWLLFQPVWESDK